MLDVQERLAAAAIGPAVDEIVDTGDMTVIRVAIAPGPHEVASVHRALAWFRPGRIDVTGSTHMQLVLCTWFEDLPMQITALVTCPQAITAIETEFDERPLEAILAGLDRLTS